jgi:hypothetical protein
MYCSRCNDNLFGKPKIDVDGSCFCYTCAKKEVATREKERREEAQNQYYSEKKAYDEARAAFTNENADWVKRRQEFVGTYGCALAIVSAVILSYLVNQLFSIGFAGVIGAFIFCGFVAETVQDIRDAKFRAIAPEPILESNEPKLQTVDLVDHFPLDHDGSTVSKDSYRKKILLRDKNTCQVCGKRKEIHNLEIHHIIPRAQGGSDDPTNLVTICKHCHDREIWYEHVRIYPTTIKNIRRPKNSS